MATHQFAYFQGSIVPLEEAKVSVVTHAFNYGTGCFEGIRGYWNPDAEQIYLFRAPEHFDRLRASAKMLRSDLRLSTDELCAISTELVRRSGFREDVYVRPLVYKSSLVVGVRLHDLQSDVVLFAVPFGPYLDVDAGICCGVSSWRRMDDNMAPARGKLTGIYVNSAFAKTEAIDNGYDEAIVLTHDGHVAEGSAENIFLVRHGALVTPSLSENILEGITRATVITLATELLGLRVIERQVDRSELYIADEVFLCGTGAQISPVIEIDHRTVGNGRVGPISAQLQRLYFDIVRGRDSRYAAWCQPVYRPVGVPGR